MYTLDAVHPITHAVGNTIKRVILIIFSVVRFGTEMTAQRYVPAPHLIFCTQKYFPRINESSIDGDGDGEGKGVSCRKHLMPYTELVLLYSVLKDRHACHSAGGSAVAIMGVFMYSVAKSMFKPKPKEA